MRVKLTYTAAVQDVLSEGANLLASFGIKLNGSVDLFNGAIKNLQSADFNSAQLHQDLDVLRNNLGELDIRLMEVIQIVDGYEQYERDQRFPPPGMPDESRDGWDPEEEPQEDDSSPKEIEPEEVLGDY
jgi:hypothetical protein|tara:strand:+ start:1447 stop:1833 length:387 start_codon:yes stop_codon:yes gene_type:complete